MAESPLSQVSPESLQELFNRSPKDYSDADVEKIVDALRAQRANFLLEEAKPKKSRAGVELKLEDLDI